MMKKLSVNQALIVMYSWIVLLIAWVWAHDKGYLEWSWPTYLATFAATIVVGTACSWGVKYPRGAR